MSDALEPLKSKIVPLPSNRDEVLRDNVFGIVSSAEDVQTKIARMLSLVPMALEVMDEARDTIQRLNEENERLRQALEDSHEASMETGPDSGFTDGTGCGTSGL